MMGTIPSNNQPIQSRQSVFRGGVVDVSCKYHFALSLIAFPTVLNAPSECCTPFLTTFGEVSVVVLNSQRTFHYLQND